MNTSSQRDLYLEKYHGLGNDYLILNPRRNAKNFELTGDEIRRICNRNFGIGSDGLLWGPGEKQVANADFSLKIYNPDGTEAEKSGNGLRIFARYVFDQGLVGQDELFTVNTLGGVAGCRVLDEGKQVEVTLGKPNFLSSKIPVDVEGREVLGETLHLMYEGKLCEFEFYAVSVGNPHCVIPVEEASPSLAKEVGPQVETHRLFPQRTNVQFLQVIDRHTLKIEIWERGAGYTLASGSSASAVAAVAYKMGWCEDYVVVQMPGGNLEVSIQPDDFLITLKGPVARVGAVVADPDIFK